MILYYFIDGLGRGRDRIWAWLGNCGYDSDLRRTMLAALSGSSQLLSATYGFDNASRLASVTDGNNNSATYSYLANSPLVSQITFKQSGLTRMTTTKQWDYLNRLTQISSAPGAAYTSPLTYNYNYNSANQRTKDTLADGSYWIYGYDSLGQVTNGCKYFSTGTPVPGQQFDYTFDTIGNRTQTEAGGDTNGANLRVANYYANNLNQITNRDIPPYVDIMGASILTNTVTVNGQTAYRNQEYFREQLPANNSASALWTNIVVAGGQNVTGNVYVAREPEVFAYDADGNLTNDGRWAYTWDGENRLTKMVVNTNVGPQYTLTFAYDPKGRRIQKTVATNGVSIYTDNFVYDVWNLIAILNSAFSLQNSFLWGNDLSGTQQGAGGVGGLLEVSYHGGPTTTNCFPVYDGNGNVMALVNAADGTLAANYDYGPFGEVIRSTGPMAKANPFRFSTKYQDDESDLLYYGFRYYKASTGTWPNRDPLNEIGSYLLRYPNFYSATGEEGMFGTDWKGTEQSLCSEENQPYLFNLNDGINLYDWLGMMSATDVQNAYQQRAAAIDAANVMCLCGCADQNDKYSISGLVFGATTAWGDTSWTDCSGSSCCGPFNSTYYWWDCYSAAASGDKNNGGWSVGSVNYPKTASPSMWEQLPGETGLFGDPDHLDMTSVVIYERCVNGKLRTKLAVANRLEFTWSILHQCWTGPTSYSH